jgi:hypothetical protein
MPNVLLMCAVLAFEPSQEVKDAALLGDANANAIAAVFSIRASITQETKSRAEPGSAWRNAIEYEWLMGQPEKIERVRMRNHLRPDRDGRPTGICDTLVENGKYRLLWNWDPQHPQKLSATERGTCRGEIGLVKGAFPGTINGRGPLLWLIYVNPVTRDLRDAIRASPKTSLKEHVDLNGVDCALVTIETPDAEGQKWHYQVYLDRRKGFAIRRVKSSAMGIKVVGREIPIDVTDISEVTEFQEPKPRIYVPRVVQVDRSDSKYLMRYRVENVVVNEPLPGAAAAFAFPEWCIVSNYQSGKTEVYGKENTPTASFANATDWRQWSADHQPVPHGSSWKYARIGSWLWLNVPLLVAFAAFVIWRGFRRKRG